MGKSEKPEDTLVEELSKEIVKQTVGSQWANVVYKSLGIGYNKLLKTQVHRKFLISASPFV